MPTVISSILFHSAALALKTILIINVALVKVFHSTIKSKLLLRFEKSDRQQELNGIHFELDLFVLKVSNHFDILIFTFNFTPIFAVKKNRGKLKNK